MYSNQYITRKLIDLYKFIKEIFIEEFIKPKGKLFFYNNTHVN